MKADTLFLIQFLKERQNHEKVEGCGVAGVVTDS